MTATIEIPDDLYRQIEARSAREGRPVQDVAVDLLRSGVEQDAATATTDLAAADERSRAREAWLRDIRQLGSELARNAPPGPTAREILEADRNRLD